MNRKSLQSARQQTLGQGRKLEISCVTVITTKERLSSQTQKLQIKTMIYTASYRKIDRNAWKHVVIGFNSP